MERVPSYVFHVLCQRFRFALRRGKDDGTNQLLTLDISSSRQSRIVAVFVDPTVTEQQGFYRRKRRLAKKKKKQQEKTSLIIYSKQQMNSLQALCSSKREEDEAL